MNKMNRKQLSDLISRIETIHEELDEIKDGEEEKFDNMPENLQKHFPRSSIFSIPHRRV